MMATLALALALHVVPPGGPWFGADKVKHYFMSALVQSASFSLARAAGMNRASSHLAAGVASTTVGVWKEIYDKRSKRPFSVPDLVWDAAGAGTAAVLLNRAR